MSLSNLIDTAGLLSFGRGTIVPLAGTIGSVSEALDAVADSLLLCEDNIAAQYGGKTSYAVGDWCVYNHKLYKCAEAHSVDYTDAYIVGATDYASDWLSLTDGGSPIPQSKGIVNIAIYRVETAGDHYHKYYGWNAVDGVYAETYPYFDSTKWTVTTLEDEAGGGGAPNLTCVLRV